MIIELYEAPESDSSEATNSPISTTTGELPQQEPDLDLGNLLGSFDSREEALAFVQNQLAHQNRRITNTRIVPFNAYIHVEWLTVTLQKEDQSTDRKNYYLVTDEGY